MEQLLNANRVNSLIRETISENGVATTVGPAEGIASAAQRDTWALSTHTYMLPLRMGMLSKQPFPAHRSPELLLQWELSPANECIEGGAGLTSCLITITNFLLVCESIERPASPMYNEQSSKVPDYYTFIDRAIAMAGRIDLAFKNWEFFQSTPVTTQKVTIPIPSRRSNVDYVLCYFQPSGADQSFATVDKFLHWNKGDGAGVSLTQAFLRRNAILYPKEAFDTTGDALETFHRFLLWHGSWKNEGVYHRPPTISLADYNTDRFLLIFDINPHQRDGLISNVSTVSDTLDMQLELLFSGVPGVPIVVNTFVQYFDQILLHADGTMDAAK